MARVYLETSFFGACVSTRTGAKADYWRQVSTEWWNNQRAKHDIFISPEVTVELSDPNFAESSHALVMLQGLQSLSLSDDVRGLSAVLVRENVMPGPSVAGDAIHVAAATVHGMEFLLSWNVAHLANPRKRRHLATICMRLGFMPPEIVTPDLLTETDDEHD